MYQLKKNTKNGKVSAVTAIGFFCVNLYDATQEQLEALYNIGYKGIEFNPKKKPKKVENIEIESTEEETDK